MATLRNILVYMDRLKNDRKQKYYKMLFLALFLTVCCYGQTTQIDLSNYTQVQLDTNELLKWRKWGAGEAFYLSEQLCIREADETQGIMLISPVTYSGDLVLRFKILALTPASVIAVILAASDRGIEKKGLSLPENYDGSFGLWQREKDNYFFAFKNAPHNKTPFVVKYTDARPGIELGAARENHMHAGKYYAVEIGKAGNKLWMVIDNERVFEAKDEGNPLNMGHIALRIRGTAGFKGAALFKDFSIFTKR